MQQQQQTFWIIPQSMLASVTWNADLNALKLQLLPILFYFLFERGRRHWPAQKRVKGLFCMRFILKLVRIKPIMWTRFSHSEQCVPTCWLFSEHGAEVRTVMSPLLSFSLLACENNDCQLWIHLNLDLHNLHTRLHKLSTWHLVNRLFSPPKKLMHCINISFHLCVLLVQCVEIRMICCQNGILYNPITILKMNV